MTTSEVEILKLKLQAQEQEALKTRSAFESAVKDAVTGSSASDTQKKIRLSQETFDSALAVSRKRVVEIQKNHNHLLSRYNQLQEAHMDLKERYDQRQQNYEQGSPPLLSRGGRRTPLDSLDGYRSSSPTPISSNTRPVQPNQKSTSYFTHARQDSKDGSMGSAAQNAAQTAASYHFGPNARSSMGSDDHSLDLASTNSVGKAKIKPQSEMRFYGRGGMQNIGKKEKDAKKDKGKGKEKDPTGPVVDSAQPVGKKKKGILGSFGAGSITPGYM